MFPPSVEEAEKFHLNRCLRVLPHQQDTGGFFLAAIVKKKLCPWESKATTAVTVDGETATADGKATTAETAEPNVNSDEPLKDADQLVISIISMNLR